MRRHLLVIAALAAFLLAGSQTAAAASQRFIVRTGGGLSSVLRLCVSANCQVQGSLDGNVGQTYLVTSSQNLLATLLNPVLNLLESLLGIQSVEPDTLLSIPAVSLQSAAAGLSDTEPVNYYGTTVWSGYVNQPAVQIINLQTAQASFQVSGTGIVADIDTGVDTTHPALMPILLPGYDFTRNQPGASEWLDVGEGMPASGGQTPQTVFVQQSTAAVLDQSTAAVLDGGPYSDFGHGTMTAGLIHLVAPTAKILPLKAFSANGAGNLSNIIAALYYAVQNHANVVNMSFDVTSASPALNAAIAYANKNGVVLVASAGNENTSARVYPAALNPYVMGIASTSDADTKSSFSNYGNADVWIAAPGESVVSTYPGATYASSSGTSFSCPLVTGSVALLLDARGGVTQSRASSALAHARPLTPNLNNGRLDVYQAVLAWLSAR
ncbi:MAG TPA: S8 family serine peptidase [Candidatus Acidoferrales bacterium]|nr:S8 family serine peptidase [Candidatus Acidoferrales bacterium]